MNQHRFLMLDNDGVPCRVGDRVICVYKGEIHWGKIAGFTSCQARIKLDRGFCSICCYNFVKAKTA